MSATRDDVLDWMQEGRLKRDALPAALRIAGKAVLLLIALLTGALLVTTVSYQAPGIATALLVPLVGFGAGNRILVGIGLLARVAMPQGAN